MLRLKSVEREHIREERPVLTERGGEVQKVKIPYLKTKKELKKHRQEHKHEQKRRQQEQKNQKEVKVFMHQKLVDQ